MQTKVWYFKVVRKSKVACNFRVADFKVGDLENKVVARSVEMCGQTLKVSAWNLKVVTQF